MQLTFSASSRNRDTPMQQLIHYFTPPFEKSKCGIGKNDGVHRFAFEKSKRRGRPGAGSFMISGVAWKRPFWRQKKKRILDSKGLCHFPRHRANPLFVASKDMLFLAWFSSCMQVDESALFERMPRKTQKIACDILVCFVRGRTCRISGNIINVMMKQDREAFPSNVRKIRKLFLFFAWIIMNKVL